ncbi:histidine phosphatase family protein [Actinokineospora baliensis]|uniref:histidine phosphatase family protein n=1 Tax=Actinokineospora baliensis TaxID=547056 RepID=UPI00195904FD
MTRSFIVRHGRTALSARYIVNGDPTRSISLDDTGQRQCRSVASEPWTSSIETCVTSQFERAIESADLILGQTHAWRCTECSLDEIDYGAFENGPWMTYGAWLDANGCLARPPGARESLNEAAARLVGGLRAALALPGPRLIVGHGLMVSILTAARSGGPVFGTRRALPEAPYASPLVFEDDELGSLLGLLVAELDQSVAASGGMQTPRDVAG